ncbi:MAG: NADH-quinone oxidoreductase subunit H, partial [Actinobacteria bacterium]|nr:NADH-quinone oxidoreductase subunit H [Actinomycetota bacterium]
ADPPIGVLLVLAMSSIAVYGVMLAGWSSGSKYPLLGSVRASAQMISYEAALGLSLAAVLMTAGTLSTSGIVSAQSSITNWHLLSTGIVPFVVFLIAMTAELNRPPFDLVEAEQELVGGFHTEYSSIRFALFFLAEFMNVISMSALLVTLFLGGPQPLYLGGTDIFAVLGPFGGTAWLLLKVFAFLYMYVWFRATLPRLRYDQLMNLGWKVLIPISLGWFILLAALQVARDSDVSGLRYSLIVAGCLVGIALAYMLFQAALNVARRNRDAEGAAY